MPWPVYLYVSPAGLKIRDVRVGGLGMTVHVPVCLWWFGCVLYRYACSHVSVTEGPCGSSPGCVQMCPF